MKKKFLIIFAIIFFIVSCSRNTKVENASIDKNEISGSEVVEVLEEKVDDNEITQEMLDKVVQSELIDASITNSTAEFIILGNSQYKPNSTKYKNFDIEQFSSEWKLFCVFNINDISKEDFARVQDVRSDGNNIDFEIIKDDFAIICGLYENFEGNVGQYIAKVDFNKNKVLQINVIDDNSNKIFYIKDYGDYFILAKRLYSLASGIIYYSDISNILPVIYD